MSPLKMLKSIFTSAPRLEPREVAHRLRAGEALLVDVREPREWTDGVAQQAALLPLSDLTGSRARWAPFLAAHSGRQLLIYCAAGGRSVIAAKILVAEGHRAADTGSLAAWAAAGWPVGRPDALPPRSPTVG
jgi:rhodanese-related sulfurtransferase